MRGDGVKESHDRKVVLITGGSSGFGKTCVNYFASSGHHVFIAFVVAYSR